MGNVLSGDEKLSHLFAAYDKKPKGIVWIDEHFGYRPANKSQKKAYDRKRTLYYEGNKDRVTRQRSHSLGAIFGELYPCDDFENNFQGHNNRKSFLPRIKISKDMPIKEDIQYLSNLDLHNSSQGKCATVTPTSSYQEQLILQEKEDTGNLLSRTLSYEDSDFNREIINKPEENYFTKNFNECMKRLQIIEKEQEIMEADGGRGLNAYKKISNLKKPFKRQMTPPPFGVLVPPPEEDLSDDSEESKKETNEEDKTTPSDVTEEKTSMGETENVDSHSEENSNNDQDIISNNSVQNEESKSPVGWYSNLKKQFETECEDIKTKDKSCRVTGATLKSYTTSTQTSSSEAKEVRHYFSRLVRSKKSLIDEELPDPDKVQNIRAMFQESLNSTLKKNFNNRFGGSLQNINDKSSEDQFARPKSAQGNRSDHSAEFQNIRKEDGEDTPTSPEKQVFPKGNAKELFPATMNNKNVQRHSSKNRIIDSLATKAVNRKFLQPKWTDTMSLSSGVSSDLSSYDTDVECGSREEIEDNSTDEDLQEEDEEKHYVQNETLEKIRSFGTSVTYFGGQMITCSVGPLLSPTTQAILEEIGEKYPDRKSFTRTFEEFYRKYTENNEPRRKNLGRTRSFGQNDVFHKPNILNNTEIEMYKNDLEIEIGIRKPSGKSQNTLKQKLVKSNSVGSRYELFEQEVVDKLNEILEAAAGMATSEENERNTAKCDSSNTNDRIEVEKEKKLGESKLNIDEQEKVLTDEPVSKEPQTQPELLFGYEKEIFNRERKPDMEFEEFEVCETVEEKMEKLEDSSQSYRLTIHVNQESPKLNEELEEIIINDQEPLDSLEIYLKTPRKDSNSSNLTSNKSQGSTLSEINTNLRGNTVLDNCNNHTCCKSNPETATRTTNTDIQDSNSIPMQHKSSKWPIETTVMIDIQKSEELTPKLVTSGKSMVKTKTRSFKM